MKNPPPRARTKRTRPGSSVSVSVGVGAGAGTGGWRSSGPALETLAPSPGCPLFDPNLLGGGLYTELAAWLRLQDVFFLDPAAAVQRLATAGSAEGALTRSEHRNALSDAEVERRIAVLRDRSVRILPILSPAYPERLRTLPDPAPVLLVRGDPRVLLGRAVAIVGARAATGYGLDVARELSGALAAAGLVVVSGLARGVDGAAHQAALDADGLTVAFSACGPDQIYPRQHRALAESIALRGACVTEMPPGTPPRAPYFPLRNRLISGLAEVVVVVEARSRSGSLVTARRAIADGREVLAVPGPIHAPTSHGPNTLLHDGAAPCRGPEDVLELLGLGGLSGAQLRLGLRPSPRDRKAPPTGLSAGAASGPLGARAASVLEALCLAPASSDELCRRLSLPPQQVAADLVELELARLVRLDRDGRMHAIRPR